MLVTDGISAPLLPTSYGTVVTVPTTTEQLTQMTTTRSAVIVPTSVSATTTSFVTSHSQAAATVTSQMMPSLSQPWGYGTSCPPSHQQVTQSLQTPLVSATSHGIGQKPPPVALVKNVEHGNQVRKIPGMLRCSMQSASRISLVVFQLQNPAFSAEIRCCILPGREHSQR